ncbi:MAG: WG repeat-containing protein [Cyclobacteriaceae bacterium]
MNSHFLTEKIESLNRICLVPILLLAICFHSSGQTLYKFYQRESKFGIQSEKGKILVPAEYEFLGWSDGKSEIIEKHIGYRKSGFWGIVSVTGETIVPAKYRRLCYAGDGLIEVALTLNSGETKEGVINLQGKTIIPFIYDYIQFFAGHIIFGERNNAESRFGFSDLSGKILLKAEWKSIRGLQNRLLLVENFNGNKALYDLAGYPKTGFFLDSAKVLSNGDIVFHEGPMTDFIRQGEAIPDKARFKAIRMSSDSITEVLRFNKWSLINDFNQEMDSLEADSVRPLSNGKLKIYRNGWSTETLADLKVSQPETYHATIRSASSIMVRKLNSGYGLSDEQGKFIYPPVYEKIEWDGTHAIIYEKNEEAKTKIRIGVPREDGWISQPFEKVIRKNNQFIVFNYGRYGLTDQYGKELIPAIYDSINDIKGELVTVGYLGKKGLITLNQKWIVFPQAYPITLVDESHFILHQPGQHTLGDRSGSFIYISSHELRNLGNGQIEELLANGVRRCLLVDGTICLVDKKPITPEVSSQKAKTSRPLPKPFKNSVTITFQETEGLIGFQENEKFGFKDTRGRIRISNRYDSIRPFQEGRAAIKLMGKWGFIDSHDQIVIQPSFSDVHDFTDSVAQVKKEKKWGIIDWSGKLLLDPGYEEMVPLKGTKYMMVKSGGKFGLISSRGKILIEPRFELLTPATKDHWMVKNKFYGIISTEGIPTIPLIHKNLYFISERNGYLVEKNAKWEIP